MLGLIHAFHRVEERLGQVVLAGPWCARVCPLEGRPGELQSLGNLLPSLGEGEPVPPKVSVVQRGLPRLPERDAEAPRHDQRLAHSLAFREVADYVQGTAPPGTVWEFLTCSTKS